MVSYIRYVYVCTFLIDVNDIVYDFRVLFFGTSLLFCILIRSILDGFLVLIFILQAACANRRGRITCLCGCRFNQWVRIVTLSKGFRLNDLSSIVGCGFIRVVIRLVCFHIDFIALSRRCSPASLPVVLMSELFSAHLIQSTRRCCVVPDRLLTSS